MDSPDKSAFKLIPARGDELMNHTFSGIELPDKYENDLAKAELSGEKKVSGSGVPKTAAKPESHGHDDHGGTRKPHLQDRPGENYPRAPKPKPQPPAPQPFPDLGQLTPAQKPASAPPSMVPPKAGKMRTMDQRAMKGTLFHYTYIWLRNGMSFWFYPVYAGKSSMAGYRWTRFGWIYAGIDLSWIEFFARAN
ncbi:MAG: hypothetical protein LBT59_03940 [Clostridiales bacterium]|nr:hypothetical protein [Clostridiales bacterium]